jgi:Skp family chaperone for outer membrane proteins
MENASIIEMLDTLYNMVTEAWGVPLGNDKCIIERDKAIELINEIKNSLPSAIAESKRLVAARDEFIGNAKREAESLRRNAEERARAMVEEQEVMRAARASSAEIIAAAEARSRELRRISNAYVEDIMRKTEESLASSLTTIRNAHNAFQQQSGQQAAAAAKPAAKPAAPKPAPKTGSAIVPDLGE